jgi:hypothetical protein
MNDQGRLAASHDRVLYGAVGEVRRRAAAGHAGTRASQVARERAVNDYRDSDQDSCDYERSAHSLEASRRWRIGESAKP